MNDLSFVKTEKGIAAVYRHPRAESKLTTQVWFRGENADWKNYHYYARGKQNDFSPGMLEAIYRATPERDIPFENWW